jgi:3-methyladenine DNA glycosylase AlkD
MTAEEVLALLEQNRDERGMKHWETLGKAKSELRSYGIGLTRLRKLAKQIGRDSALAGELWKSDLYDARVVALLIDDPKRMTRLQAETQVEQLEAGMLEHVFSSCDATLARVPYVVELADEWMRSDDPVRQRCGYGLLYEISKFSGKKAPNADWFREHVDRIERRMEGGASALRMAMGAALMGIGKRSAALNAAALRVAEATGPIEFESASGKCEPFDVAKHLRTERLQEKLTR